MGSGGPDAPGPSGNASADGISVGSVGADIARADRLYDLSEPQRAAQVAARGAEEAARRAELAAATAPRGGVRQAKVDQSLAPGELSSEIVDASKDAARSAADASREAERASETAARAAAIPTPDAAAIVRRETNRARDAAERAWEAVDEAADRPAPRLPAPTELATSTPGFFQGLRRLMQAEAAFARGSALLEARKYQEARDHFAAATALSPEHDQARAMLAWSEYFLGDFRGATITFKSALRRQPSWEGLYNGLGWSRLRLGRYQLAAAAFQSALARNPDYLDALNGLGSAQFERGNYEAALPSLEKALEGSRRVLSAEPPEVTTLRGKMAWSLYYLERHREALAMFIRASLAAPDSHQYQVGMGWCYLKLGQRDDARAAFRRALQLGPGDEAVREGLRRVGI
jgi:tetratricopeptide (TPR) repeat protein